MASLWDPPCFFCERDGHLSMASSRYLCYILHNRYLHKQGVNYLCGLFYSFIDLLRSLHFTTLGILRLYMQTKLFNLNNKVTIARKVDKLWKTADIVLSNS